jgi:2-hydroxychromene-2-carboxylate isomerase
VTPALQSSTSRAWQDGVQGVPTLRIGEQLFFGDDHLEEAAAAMPPPGSHGRADGSDA